MSAYTPPEDVPVPTDETPQADWFGHPRQLARLFTTEMWERFGYYGMRAILTLYLSKHFLFNDKTASGLYGAFTSLVYLTPLIGGLLADRFLGSKRSVKFGAILMAIGYFALCFGGHKAKPYVVLKSPEIAAVSSESNFPVSQETLADGKTKQRVDIQGVPYDISGKEDGSLVLTPPEGAGAGALTLAKDQFVFDAERDPTWVAILFVALSCVIVGNGFFKPNISTIVGSLYKEGDPRRDAGFTIFYMGINLGSMISQFLCPLLAEAFGYWAGFLLAAIGMLTAWALFQFDGNRLKGHGEAPQGTEGAVLPIYIGAIVAIPLVWFLIHNTMVNAQLARAAATEGKGILEYLASLSILGKSLFLLFLISVIGIPIWSLIAGTKEEAQKMIVAVVLIVFSVVFWTLFEQAGSSLTFFADRNTDRMIGTYEMPAAQTQIFNPLFIVIFAPVFSWLWVWLAKRGLEPNIPVKFAISLVLVGVGFLLLVFGAKFAGPDFKVGLGWLVLAYLIHSIGELCLSPVGLSMITKLSIARVVGLMMGVWFLSSSMAQYVGGIIAQFASVETVGGEVANLGNALATYVSVFNIIGWWSVGFGILLFVFSPLLKRMMHGVR